MAQARKKHSLKQTTSPTSLPGNNSSSSPNLPPELTPAELLDGLSKVVEELQSLIDNPSKKPVTEEIALQVEKIRQASTFLSAVYANMVHIAVDVDKVIPEAPTEEQRTLAARTEALGWKLKALQEKAVLRMSPPPPQKSITAKKRKARMERTQGDGEWKRM